MADRSARAVEEMFAYHDAGFTTWDLADHYGPAEDFIGEFRRQFAAARGAARLAEIQAFTKWVPRPGPMTRAHRRGRDRRLAAAHGRRALDLLQFHWWDYADERYLDALKHLADLQHEGKIRHLALTNFDTERLRIIAEHGIRIVSNQVQYSLVDRRPEGADGGVLPRARHHAADLRHAARRPAFGEISRPARAAPRRAHHRVACRNTSR